MKRLFIILFLSVLSIPAAVIQGVVTEQRSGYSLSRATVTLEPIGSITQHFHSLQSTETGQFTFDALPAGVYLLKAAHRGFLPMQYGQRRWDSAGTLVSLDSDTVLTLRLPMLRYGGIVGTVRDANEVGIADQEVAAYTATKPPRLVAQAQSDDRGIFRIGGLEPGTYLVRTTGNKDEERSYLPTFSHQTLLVDEAALTTVYADEDTPGNDVRPIPGMLFSLSGSVAPLPANFQGSVTVTLASDLGRRTANSSFFNFHDLAPGHYELYAEAREAEPGLRVFGAYADIYVARNMTRYTLQMYPLRDTYFTLSGAGRDVSGTAILRRRDYAGIGSEETVTLGAMTRVTLLPGRWDVRIVPPSGMFVSDFSTGRTKAAQPQGWNDIYASEGGVSATLSGGPAMVHGIVRSSGNAARGAPVFLESWDPITRNRVDDLRQARTDANGNYRFDNLAPGDYRVLATEDYIAPEPRIFDASGAAALKLERQTDTALDLELWGNQ